MSIINCKHRNGALFSIDPEANILIWDIEGWNDEAELYKTIADYGDRIEVFISGVYAKHANGNSYSSPTISIDNIEECDNIEELEKVFTL